MRKTEQPDVHSLVCLHLVQLGGADQLSPVRINYEVKTNKLNANKTRFSQESYSDKVIVILPNSTKEHLSNFRIIYTVNSQVKNKSLIESQVKTNKSRFNTESYIKKVLGSSNSTIDHLSHVRSMNKVDSHVKNKSLTKSQVNTTKSISTSPESNQQVPSQNQQVKIQSQVQMKCCLYHPTVL